MGLVVVKVGGSLFDLPQLRRQLEHFLATLAPDAPLLVPGGGAAADAVRALDRTHHLGDQLSHWLALKACELNAHFLARLLGLPVVDWPAYGPAVLGPYSFCRRDEGRPGCLPHQWSATSDSVAARVAEVAAAPLVLLKSTPLVAGMTWQQASEGGLVDNVFPALVARAGTVVRLVNLRAPSG